MARGHGRDVDQAGADGRQRPAGHPPTGEPLKDPPPTVKTTRSFNFLPVTPELPPMSPQKCTCTSTGGSHVVALEAAAASSSSAAASVFVCLLLRVFHGRLAKNYVAH